MICARPNESEVLTQTPKVRKGVITRNFLPVKHRRNIIQLEVQKGMEMQISHDSTYD